MQKASSHTTRGDGVLENYLSKLRAKKADQLISDNLRGGKILDMGCGSYPYFLLNTKFESKFGIDPALTTTRLDKVNLKKIDISNNKLPFDNGYFNVVTMLAVFEHIEKEKLSFVLKEFFRVLKSGGELIITTPSPWSDKLLHQMAKVGLISSVEIHDHKSHYNMDSIKNIISKAFNKEAIECGYFELGFNMWFKIVK